MTQVDKGLNAFLRVGTGQGKSVIIAMLAAHYAKRGCKVYVFTCYSHLAVRDAERFNNFFEKLGIKAAAIKQGSQVCDASVSVMYSDLHTFLCARQSEVLRRCKPDCSTEWSMEAYRGLFEVGERSSVVLLDEFDALILQHASVGNTVYDIKDVVTVGSMKQSDLESTQAFKDAILHRNPDMSSEFMEALSDVGLDETILAFLSAPGGWNAGHSGYDALGKHHQYIGGNLHELCNRGNFYSRLLATKCLSLLQSYNYVIGISGSITAKEVKCFSKLFDRRPCYVEIPPYYGPDSSKNNQLKDLRSLQTGKWLQEIAGDAKMAVQTGRPVLVFLHPENPHWHQLLSALQAVAGSKGVQEIKSENDIRDELLGKACEEGMVTLSSHVAGRGADFVVQNDIKRKGGLHVIIAYEPTDGKSRRGYNELDQRMVDQMKGRTARMGAPGSYSIITTTALPTNTVETIEGKQELNHKHILTTHIFSRLASDGSATAAHWKRYAFFTCFLDQSTRMPAGLEHHLALQGGGDGISGVQNAAEHVLRNIIGFPSFPLPISPAPRRSNIFVSNRVQPVDVTPSSHDVRNAGRQHVRAQQGRGVGSSDRPSTTDGGGWRWAAIFSTGGFAAVAAGCSIQ